MTRKPRLDELVMSMTLQDLNNVKINLDNNDSKLAREYLLLMNSDIQNYKSLLPEKQQQVMEKMYNDGIRLYEDKTGKVYKR